jgi:hypothetical protein
VGQLDRPRESLCGERARCSTRSLLRYPQDLRYLGTPFNNGQPAANFCVEGFDTAAFIGGSALSASNLWILQNQTDGRLGQFDRRSLRKPSIGLTKRQAGSVQYGPSYPPNEAVIEQERGAWRVPPPRYPKSDAPLAQSATAQPVSSMQSPKLSAAVSLAMAPQRPNSPTPSGPTPSRGTTHRRRACSVSPMLYSRTAARPVRCALVASVGYRTDTAAR